MSNGAGRPEAVQAGRIRLWELAAAAAALAAFVALRWPLLTARAAVLGWNSDAAVFGLMARRILGRGHIDVFFWGQDYLGPLTPLVAAAVALFRRAVASDPSGGVDALALRIAGMAEIAAGTAFYWLGLRVALGRLAALPCLLWLAIGPLYLFERSVTPMSDEIAFLCGGVLFWIAARSFAGARRPGVFETRGGCFFAGLVSGFGWWMSQGVVFILLPAAILLARRAPAWADLGLSLRPLDRLLIRGEGLGWKPLPQRAVWFLLAWQGALAALPLAVLVAPSVLPSVISVAVPCLLLLLWTQILLELVLGDPTRQSAFGVDDALARLHAVLPRGASLAGGFLLGYSPVLVGRPLGWYATAYTRPEFSVGLDRLLPHLRDMVQRDLWEWIGADRSAPGVVFAAGFAVGLGLLVWERRREIRAFASLRPIEAGAPAFVGCAVLVSLAFYAVALRLGGEARYIGAAVPAAYGLAAAGFLGVEAAPRRRSIRVARALALSAVVACGLASQYRQAERQVSTILAEPDPRPLLQAILDRGYGVCYAASWDSYKLQFLSEERVRFIPYMTRSRNRDEDRANELEPGEKCLLLRDGTFRAFRPSDVPRRIDPRAEPERGATPRS